MRRASTRPARDELGRLENVQGRKVAIFRFAFVDVCQGGIGGAQVDADFHVSSSLQGDGETRRSREGIQEVESAVRRGRG